MKTYSQLLNRSTIDLAEASYRASTNHFLLGRVEGYVDTLRATYPQVRYCTYALHRLMTPGYADIYEAAVGMPAGEAGYLHTGGAIEANRNRVPAGAPGTADDWYVMNMRSSIYLNWRRAETIKALRGTDFGQPAHTTGPMDAVDLDLLMWYPEFDVPPNSYAHVLSSDEYSALPELAYQDDCVADLITMHALAISEGLASKIVPNFGDIASLMRTDYNTLAAINSCSMICTEVTLRYDGGKLESPNALSADNIWNFINQLCLTKELIAHGWMDHPPHTDEEIDQAMKGVAAFFLMADSPNLFSRFVLDISEPSSHISSWEQNTFMSLAKLMLGEPIGPRTIVNGSWVEGVLYRREFEHGIVLLQPQAADKTGDEPAIVSGLVNTKELQTSFQLGPYVTSVSLGVGDGMILIRDTEIIPPPIVPPPPGGGGSGAGGKSQGRNRGGKFPRATYFSKASRKFNRSLRGAFRPRGSGR